ncbi:MAG: DUF4349 domain-containing protein [Polyangiaceae bacterium]|nr:DUF4349 domain-containing protein [Polyangiaceae bacterium]
MRLTLHVVLMGLLLALLSACGGAMGGSKDAAASPVMAEPMPAEAPAGMEEAESDGDFGRQTVTRDFMGMPTGTVAPPPPPPPAGGVPGSTPAVPSEVAVMRGPLLIYTAQFTMSVFEVSASLSQIEDLGRELGGFLSKRSDNSITIRVPVQAFDQAIKRIEKLGDVLNRNVTAQDVTEEFRDLEIRLRNSRAVRDRLEQLLAKANKVEESVMVERELERVAGEIERMEGRIKFLKDRAAFSTITVTFQPKRPEETSRGPFRLPVPWLYQLGLSRLLNL